MPRGRELEVMIERELRDQGVTEFSFDHTSRHSRVTWKLNGLSKTFPFPAKSPDQRARLNIRSEVRRYCRFMKEGKAPTRH